MLKEKSLRTRRFVAKYVTYVEVFGYLFVIRANRAAEVVAELATEERAPARTLAANDIALQRGGAPVEAILRFHAALRELTGPLGLKLAVERCSKLAMTRMLFTRKRSKDSDAHPFVYSSLGRTFSTANGSDASVGGSTHAPSCELLMTSSESSVSTVSPNGHGSSLRQPASALASGRPRP